jgi:hypothetical protein
MKHLTPYRLNETSLSPVRGRGMVYGGGLRDYRMNPTGLVKSGYHVAEIFCASSRICSKKRLVASSFVRLASSAASFINCESIASEGSSILVNRYVSIVGFITMIFLFLGAKIQRKIE